ncbi:MAG: S8 family serine peptidase, partial [Sphingomicrobium sp.]
ARLRNRIEARSGRRSRVVRAGREIWDFLRRPAVAAVATAQLALIAVGAWLVQPVAEPAYVGLGSSQTAAAANVIVMFRPEAREAELRATLRATEASLVDGPTEADAYMLHVAPDSRAAALAKLRTDPNVTLVQPIDGPAQ